MTTKVVITHEGKKGKDLKIEQLDELGSVLNTNILTKNETISYHIDKTHSIFLYEINSKGETK